MAILTGNAIREIAANPKKVEALMNVFTAQEKLNRVRSSLDVAEAHDDDMLASFKRIADKAEKALDNEIIAAELKFAD